MAVYLEPSPKRVRAQFGGETVADSRRVMILHEAGAQPIYYFPPQDVRFELLSPLERHTYCPKKGEASYYEVRVGERTVAAWYYPQPLEAAPPELAGLIAFPFAEMDAWLEEDEEILGHPRDPYHRIDILSTSRHVRVSSDGELLAESTRALALFESNLPVRWYLPRSDVIAELEPSDTVSYCPYKGQARYFSVAGGEDLVWYYEEPLAEVARIAGLVCFFNERVEIELDGELQGQPESPWSGAGAR